MILGSLALLISVALFFTYRPDQALHVATGLIAHEICAKTFISGFAPKPAFAEIMQRPRIRWLKGVTAYRIDRSALVVQASVKGLADSQVTFHDGYGCRLVHPNIEPHLLKADTSQLKEPTVAPLLAEIAGPAVVDPLNHELKDAVDQAFSEPVGSLHRGTKAIVVVHNNTVIGERYAPGVGVETPLSGYSMAKSVVNGLLGVLAAHGRLSISQSGMISEWQAKDDPRGFITIEQLMRMTSGLALDENSFGFDIASRMLYLHGDTRAFAAQAPLIAPPGTRWAYSSPSVQLLTGIIRDVLGGQPERTLEFAWRELFNPLGMRSVTLEFDTAGTLIGAAFISASARDWARLGLLYLNDGVVGGHRLLPEGWVAASAEATLDTDYGAGFWTNRSGSERAKERIALGMPHDAFFAYASLGQVVLILPSQHLVIVRLGDAVDDGDELRRLAGLAGAVVAATKH